MAVFAFAAVAISITFLLYSLRGFTREMGPWNRYAVRRHTMVSRVVQIRPSIESTQGIARTDNAESIRANGSLRSARSNVRSHGNPTRRG